MPRSTKASQILNDAAMRLEAAKIRERTAQSELNVAKATLEALQTAYNFLEEALAPKPRNKPVRAAAAKEPTADPRCGVCYEIEDHSNHDLTYSSAHKFDRPKSVAAAPKRSSRRTASTKADQLSIASSGTPPVAVGNVAQESLKTASGD